MNTDSNSGAFSTTYQHHWLPNKTAHVVYKLNEKKITWISVISVKECPQDDSYTKKECVYYQYK